MIANFNIVGTMKDSIDKFKIIESRNKVTDDRCLNSREGILPCPLLLNLSIIFFISIGEKYTLLI